MPTLSLDGKTVTVPDGAHLLEAARQAGATIPTLCAHPALEPSGGCRLCVVDVTRPEWHGWTKMVVSCMYPAEDGLVVDTRSPRVVDTRRVVLDLLLARCPDAAIVRRLARDHGLETTSYPPASEPTDCVLCGLCTRVCDQIGASAISSTGRGVGREIAPPFRRPPKDCVGCLACAQICPTSCIPFEDAGETRRIWGACFAMRRCRACGRAHLTEQHAELLTRTRGLPESFLELCDACKRQQLTATVASLGAPA